MSNGGNPVSVRLLLARHGETDWNREGRWQGQTDVPLNESGRAQAIAIAEQVRGSAPARIVSSDLARAHETAQIVARRLELPVPDRFSALRERSYGEFEGRSGEECAAIFPAAWADWRAGRIPDPPGAEPRHAAGTRMRDELDRLAREHVSELRPLLVVTHGGAIRAFLLVAFTLEVPPVSNGGIYLVRWECGTFVAADPFPR